jgi:hypothetical protein
MLCCVLASAAARGLRGSFASPLVCSSARHLGSGCRWRHCARLKLPVDVGGADRGAAEINNDMLKINLSRFDRASASRNGFKVLVRP